MAILKARKTPQDPWETVGVGNPTPEEIDTHNTSSLAHPDIRQLIEEAVPTYTAENGQFAVSDGKGGLRFVSLENYAEVGK